MSNDDAIREEVLMRMRKDPKLFNTQRRMLAEGMKAMGLRGSPGVVEFKLYGRSFPEDTGDVRLMHLVELRRPVGAVWSLYYCGMLSGKCISAYDVSRKMMEFEMLLGHVAKTLLVASGKRILVYMEPGPGHMSHFLANFELTQPYLVEPNCGLVCQTLADFCRQYPLAEDKT